MIAVTILATFILPMLWIIAESRTRAIRYTLERQVRSLAQQKLHDRVHYYEIEDQGTFEDDGRIDWTWEILPPEMRAQGEQVVLTYTIRVRVPQRIGDESQQDGEGTVLEYTMWSLPDEKWYEEQDLLFERGMPSLLYGDPRLDGAAGAAGVMGAAGSFPR